VTDILESVSKMPHYGQNIWTVANPRPPHCHADSEQTPIITAD
jgi:hypothetical protein